MKKNNDIEKAKYVVGQPHPTRPNRLWTEYAPGKFDWKSADGKYWKGKNKGSENQSQTTNQPTSSSTPAQSGNTNSTPSPKPQPQKSAPYDAPKPKVVYKNQPASEIAEEARVPEKFTLRKRSTGKDEVKDRAQYRKAYSTLANDKLLNILNNPNGSWELRTIAYEEAQSRGIPEDKVNISGSLEHRWKTLKSAYDIANPKQNSKDDDEDYASVNDAIYSTFDYDKIKDLFPNGDDGWKDANDSRIREQFNNLKTKMDRQKYDAFLDRMKRESPYYETPEATLQALGRDIIGFLTKKEAPMFVSSGGAGAGKTTRFRDIIDEIGMKEWSGKDGDNDYHYVFMGNDVEDIKQLSEVLHKHNGKLIVFDDKDKLLTTTSIPLMGLMKGIADGNPKNRKFTYNGKQEHFTGKLFFITNKTQDVLNKDEDHKAIMSRAAKNDIRFTVNENLELLTDRYKTMGEIPALKDDPETEQKVRQTIYDYIMNNATNLDPKKFTVRKFNDILDKVNSTLESNDLSKQNAKLNKMLGGNRAWEREIEIELNKGDEDSLEKGLRENEFEELSYEMKQYYKKLYAKNPKKFVELFGKDIIDAINGENKEETEEEVVKAFVNDFDMSLEEAENLLLN